MKAFARRKMEISSNFIDLQKTMKIAPLTFFLLNLLNEPFSLTLQNTESLVITTQKGRRNSQTGHLRLKHKKNIIANIHTQTKQNVTYMKSCLPNRMPSTRWGIDLPRKEADSFYIYKYSLLKIRCPNREWSTVVNLYSI